MTEVCYTHTHTHTHTHTRQHNETHQMVLEKGWRGWNADIMEGVNLFKVHYIITLYVYSITTMIPPLIINVC
jgi:hypothetical protein